MTGRGADKSNLATIGRDVLLVTGFDERAGRIRVSVPPGADLESRVSVDAVEHHGIYREFPEVGAILHLHAWLPGISSTAQSYPCGTLELAEEVLALLRKAPDPANAGPPTGSKITSAPRPPVSASTPARKSSFR